MEFKLSDAKIGEPLIVTRVETSHKMCLLQMGLTPDTQIEIFCICGFGSNFLINVRGVKLAMRKECCDNIYVKYI